jgi:hypothetical protein
VSIGFPFSINARFCSAIIICLGGHTNMFSSLRFRISKRNLLPVAALTVTTVFTAGCANFLQVAPLSNEEVAGGTITGRAHGGNQPISGATVKVIAAGNAGYGSAGTVLATTTTDSSGNFTFGPGSGNTYSCPASNSATASQMLYITASGGQPTTGVTNTASVLMAALGDCSTVISTQPFVNVNEVTTIASMVALQQFFNPATETFGASSTNISGLTNAFATVNNLITLSTGSANASSTVSGTAAAVSGASVTITPEQTKINTLGNILASCVNTNGAASTNCTALFSNVTSPATTDTLLAAYYLAVNPQNLVSGTSNIANVYNLAAAQAAFQPSLSAAPGDWTIGITYGSSSSQTVASTPVYLLTRPENLAIDSTGNVWIDNYAGTAVGTIGNSVTELSPTGKPLNQVLMSTPGVTPANGTLLIGSFSIAIDPSNNVYVTSYGASAALGSIVAEYTTGGATNVFTTAAGPTAVASDGAGNVYVSTTSSTSSTPVGGADLEKIPAGSASGTTPTQLATGVTDSSFSDLGVDSTGGLWLTAASAKGTTQFLCTTTAPFTCSGTSTTVGGQGSSEPLALDSGNNIWVANFSSTAGKVSKINANTTNANFTGAGPFTATATNSVEKVAIDGGGNLWLAGGTTTVGSVGELSNAGVQLSPPTASGFNHTYAGPNGIAIDGSGNVWIGNGGTAVVASPTVQAYVTEIVGAAVPTVTPMAAGLPVTVGGTNKVGTRP